MSMDFSQGAGQDTGSGVIPNGQLAFAIINVRGVKGSRSGGQYIDVELTIDDGQPYAHKKLWEMIGDPNHPGNSEDYRQMGMVAIARILEAGRGAGPHNPALYQISDYSQLSGLRVPIRIRVEKGKDGYDDKNKVGEWLTPNPQSKSGYKDYQLLMSGVYNRSQQGQQAPAAGGFGAPAQTGFAASPAQATFGQTSFGGQAPAPVAAPAGFGTQPGFPAAQVPGQGSAAPFGTQPTTGTSPSDQPNSWLAQANQPA